MIYLRYLLQASFIALFAYIGYRHQAIGGGPAGSPPLDAYCPFGAIETLPAYLMTGHFIEKTASSNLWIFGLLIGTVLLFGAVFCGWLCPLGGLSNWLFAFRQKLWRRKFEFSPKVSYILSYGRYVMLLLIFYFSWKLGKLWFEDYDPFKLIFHMDIESATAGIIIAVFVLSSLLIDRFWCRYLCPLSAIIGPVSKFSLFTIRRNTDSCINCKSCDTSCPNGIKPSQQQAVQDSRCIHCFQCIEQCPAAQTLTVQPRISSFRGTLKPVVVVLSAFFLVGGVLSGVKVLGYWNPTNPNIKATAQLTDTADIKGWMKWNEVIMTFELNEQQLIDELKLSSDFDRNKTLKTLAQEYGLDVDNIRSAIQKLRKE